MTNTMLPTIMRVPHFKGGGQIDFIEKPVPTPGPGQLLLQVKANALCGSERGQFFNGTNTTPGHEAAGVVVAAGANTQSKPGTPGVVFLMDFCGECRSCRLGLTNQCLQKRGDMGFNRDGGYGVYELVNENLFLPVDPALPLTEATLLLDVMGTTAHAINRAQRIHLDLQSLVVTGAGPIGLGVLAMAKIMLGESFPVLISDVVGWRLSLAEQLGGKPINLTQTTLAEGAKQHGLLRVDGAFDTSGKEVARRSALDLLDKRGVLVCIGHGEGLSVTVSPDLIATERAILGSEYFCFNELPANVERLQKHLPYLQQIITHRFPVSEIQHAFELFWKGEAGKVVIEQ
ncbi:MAG: alcohol dehydrogenase catalytic domain-containing protein [Caldilineaceae bacterium]